MTGQSKQSDYEIVTLSAEEMRNFFAERAYYELVLESIKARVATRSIFNRGVRPPDMERVFADCKPLIASWIYSKGSQ